MSNLTAEQIIATMAKRFTSGNPIAVERAHITREEWRALLAELLAVAADGHDPKIDPECPRCQLVAAIEHGLERLT